MNPPVLAPEGETSLRVTRAAPPSPGSAPIDRYDLRHSVDGTTWTVVQGIGATETLTGLSPGTTYRVQTRAVNAVGAGSWSMSSTTATAQPATPPAAFAAAQWSLADNADGGGMTVTVGSLPGNGGAAITGLDYRVDGGGWTALGGAVSGAYGFTWATLAVPISVEIRAVNAVGAGPASDTKQAVPTAPATAPAAMAAPSAVATGSGAITVSLGAAPADGGSPITRYDLRISTDEAAWTIITGVEDPEPVTGLTAETSYFVQTRAVNAVGAGGWSASASATTGSAATAPGAMAAPVVSPVSEAELSVDRAAAPADGGSPITRYDLRYSADQVVWTVVSDIGDPEGMTGLSSSTTYFVQTRAVNAVGAGSWSASGSAATAAPATAPATMAAPTVSMVSETELSVGRAAAPADGGAPITQYDLRYSTDEATWTVISDIAAVDVITGLSSGALYHVQTRAVNAVGAGAWSPSGSGSTDTSDVPVVAGSIADQVYDRGIAIAPLDLSGAFSGTVESYRLSGTSDGLPAGLVLDASSGTLNGTPTEASQIGEPFQILAEAVNGGGASEPVEFAITVEQIQITDVSFETTAISFTTNVGNGQVYWTSGGGAPSEADLIAGNGAGIDVAGSFTVNGSGGSGELDLTDYVGQDRTISFMQVAAGGEWSALISTTQTIAASRPAVFAGAMWSVATGAGDSALDVTISGLPGNGGSPITDVEYDLDGSGSWTPLPSFAGAGTYVIDAGAPSAAVTVRLRAVNAHGAANAGNSESATSGAATAAATSFGGWGTVAKTADGAPLTTLTANMPAGVAPGDMLVAFAAADDGPTLTGSTGWTKLFQSDQFGTVTGAVFYRIAGGGANDAFALSSSAAQEMSLVVGRATGVSFVSGAIGNNLGFNPPAHTPSGTGKIWLAGVASDSSDAVTAGPASYANFVSGGGGAGSSCQVSAAVRILDAASENPGAFGGGGGEQNVCWTVALW